MPISFVQPAPDTHQGLWLINYPIFTDSRGSFASPLIIDPNTPPDCALDVTQCNCSISEQNVLRGIHAEYWDKWIYVIDGSVFVAIVNLCRSNSRHFGTVYTTVLRPGRGIFVPRGFGNSFLALERTIYGYAVSEVWQPDVRYLAVDPFDFELAIPWPIDPDTAILSEKDRANPSLATVRDRPLGATPQ